MPDTAFERVLAEPASLAARYALLAEWQTRGDPRAELLEMQLAERARLGSGRCDAAHGLSMELLRLFKEQLREWAGRVAELVEDFRFHRGLVAQVKLSGTAFQQHAAELLAIAPIQHVSLIAPLGSIAALAAMPELARLSSLSIHGGNETVGDQGAIALAGSPHLRNLAYMDLGSNNIGKAGVEALAASPALENVQRLYLSGNPADPTPTVERDYEAGLLVVRYPSLAQELIRRHGTRPWLALPRGDLDRLPEQQDELALLRDDLSDELLAGLEKLARDLDLLAAAAGNSPAVVAERTRLHTELGKVGVFGGTFALGQRLARFPTLWSCHDAAIGRDDVESAYSSYRGNHLGTLALDLFRVPTAHGLTSGQRDAAIDYCNTWSREYPPSSPRAMYVDFVDGKFEYALDYRQETLDEVALWRVRALPGPPRRVLDELEELAGLVDRLATQGDEPQAYAKRMRLLIELDVTGLLASAPGLRERLRRHPQLLAYHDAALVLADYRASRGTPAVAPLEGNVSLDWFRLPVPLPERCTAYEWLDLCERNLLDPPPESGEGTRFVRLAGAIRLLEYRREVGPTPRLWRVTASDGDDADSRPELRFGDTQQFARALLAALDAPPNHERQVYEEWKERGDRALLLRMYIATGQTPPEPTLAEALADLAEHVARAAPEDPPAPMVLPFRYRGREGTLRFEQSQNRAAQRFVALELASESGQSKSTQWLGTGSNAELAAFLRRPQTVLEAAEAAEEAFVRQARFGLG